VAEGPPSSLRPTTNRLRIEVDDLARARQIVGSLNGVSLDGEGAESGSGSMRVSLTPPATAAYINASLIGAGVSVSALVPEHESLEDVFVSLVEGADVPR
jgi:hypothetical protein